MSSSFDKLARPVQKWVRSKDWQTLRPIQSETINTVMNSNADMIVSAKTAGGKTEAAFLPLISQVLDDPAEGGGFDLVYVGPLKALITDQAMRLDDICHEADLPIYPWHGDVSESVKKRALKAPKGILLITPESLEALFVRRGLEIPRLFGRTRTIVIDELHNFLDSERGMQMRSLLTRLEIAVRRPIRRVGLSATIGNMNMASGYLRPDAAGAVKLIEYRDDGSELRLQLRGYVSDGKEENAHSVPNANNADETIEHTDPAINAVSMHLFENLRGSHNLIFAGARRSVEIYADKLRGLCEDGHLPLEFYPHHANLSREHRNYLEKRLKNSNLPTTAVCTSTLELGIDIGDVKCVAQVGAPFSVASLCQRLGRSGRKEGQPQILRQYAVETKLDGNSNFVDQLRLGLVRAIAMIELLLDGWCEPPKAEALHLSTLVHQTLSVIAERGGARANGLYQILCEKGPFRQVDKKLFGNVLRAIARPEAGLIEQAPDGMLLLGPEGERIVEHYKFYAVFKTPEEFRLVVDGKEIGRMPIDNILSQGMQLIFSGRRWVVLDVHNSDKVIQVEPATAGVPPVFGGDPGIIHDRVIDKMFEILEGVLEPIYMDQAALGLLKEARGNFTRWKFSESPVVVLVDGSQILATRRGTVKTTALAMALGASGFGVMQHDGFLWVNPGKARKTVGQVLSEMANGEIPDLFAHEPNLIFEKYHSYLTNDLLELDALSMRVDADCLQELCSDLQPVDSESTFNPAES